MTNTARKQSAAESAMRSALSSESAENMRHVIQQRIAWDDTASSAFKASGKDPWWMRDVICQPCWAPGEAEVYAALRVNAILAECGGCVRIPVGDVPAADAEVDRNREVLQRGLERFGFNVDLWCGTADCDGVIEPDHEMHFASTSITVDGPVNRRFSSSARAIELEVGYTHAWTTFNHLTRSGTLARWPYGSDRVTVIAIEPSAFRKILQDRERVLFGVKS